MEVRFTHNKDFVYLVNITNITAYSRHLVQVEKQLQNDASKIERHALLHILLGNQSLHSTVYYILTF